MIEGKAQSCPLCGNPADGEHYFVPEMMFGSKEQFEYVECGRCRGMFLLNPPADMGKYYPKDYYSFHNMTGSRNPWWKKLLKHARAKYELTGQGILGKILSDRQGVWPYFSWFKAAGVGFNSSILDIGCGRGDYLVRFASDGFTKLTGVDPYIDNDIHLDGGITIYKRQFHEMEGQFDCLFSKDSYEHMLNPRESLKAMHALVRSGGVTLIAIPVAGCDAWKEYGTSWFQIDAPRHITIPSPESMRILAADVGFIFEKVLFDSSADQFRISEAYRRGISLKEIEVPGANSLFTPEELHQFEKKALAANVTGRGDHACFVLRKPQ